ncbi:protein liaI [Bacillus swezeyi]|uniref:Protein liaI n=1 Tax=Bacillus swezeyi TaxID=1925020 RepID=A0A5M8RTD6_9BACI|nr:protein liaI [Bacillus swezeyi]KAA6450610.1 protein liaI [Bacillus swezeyi]KAA6475214.1 protein liaI [Bacillus swezeyi]
MNINGKSVIGFFLILFGISLFFGGGHFGGLITGAIGAVLIYYGIKKWKEGRQFAAVILAIIGIMFLGGSLPFLIGIALAAAMVYFGWKMMKQDGKQEENIYYSENTEPSAASYDTGFDAEWEDFLKKNK